MNPQNELKDAQQMVTELTARARSLREEAKKLEDAAAVLRGTPAPSMNGPQGLPIQQTLDGKEERATPVRRRRRSATKPTPDLSGLDPTAYVTGVRHSWPTMALATRFKTVSVGEIVPRAWVRETLKARGLSVSTNALKAAYKLFDCEFERKGLVERTPDGWRKTSDDWDDSSVTAAEARMAWRRAKEASPNRTVTLDEAALCLDMGFDRAVDAPKNVQAALSNASKGMLEDGEFQKRIGRGAYAW